MTLTLIKIGTTGQMEFDFTSLEALTSGEFVEAVKQYVGENRIIDAFLDELLTSKTFYFVTDNNVVFVGYFSKRVQHYNVRDSRYTLIGLQNAADRWNYVNLCEM